MTSDNAPDGGPSRRRPTESDVDLLDQISRVQDGLQQLSSDVSEIGGSVQTARDENTRLSNEVSALADRVSAALGDSGESVAVLDWWTLDQEQAETAWSGLWQWLAEFYVPRYLPTREELPDCWTRHAGIRDELSWLWCAHRAAYAPHVPVGVAAHWHTLWRHGAFQQVANLAQRLDCAPGRCRGQRLQDGPPPDSRELSDPARWFTDGIQADVDTRTPPAEPATTG